MCDHRSDQDEFDAESFRGRVQGFIMQSVKDWAIAEDLTQETFFAFWKSSDADTIAGDRQAFLFSIAYNQVKAYWRKKKTIPVSNKILDSYQSPNVEYSREEQLANIQHLLNLLREHFTHEDVALMSMKYLDKLTFEQIAVELNCVASTASDRHQRILNQLRVLAKENPPPDFETGSSL
ncbi:RNA polymerase sigma factor [Gimesia fumaroli]|uniref:RNA polymerase sigma factor n=1 Tax=Gimesia fumaroli TaxID=2527976 RepID=A0A518I5W8_9PLAN|nr:sigma-70 family RNA polymerase sigma factor [Gimesia fumaroli]QDV48497.1 RNA polymerase sigma factor [Gimesia fumaroli]